MTITGTGIGGTLTNLTSTIGEGESSQLTYPFSIGSPETGTPGRTHYMDEDDSDVVPGERDGVPRHE